MRLILFFISSIVLANVVWAMFFWREPAKATGKPEPIVNSVTQQGHDPRMANGRYNAPGRDMARKSVLHKLGTPWSAFCAPEGHKELIAAINYYYDRAKRRCGAATTPTARPPSASRSNPGPRPTTIGSNA
jgi:hypothetical protein